MTTPYVSGGIVKWLVDAPVDSPEFTRAAVAANEAEVDLALDIVDYRTRKVLCRNEEIEERLDELEEEYPGSAGAA